MSPAPVVSVSGLAHEYPTPTGSLRVLNGVDLQVPASGYTSLMGASGSGKSTLLALLGALTRPQSGSISVAGHDLTRLPHSRLPEFRSRTIGFVFQHFGLVETLSALDNVAVALALRGARRAEQRDRARELLDAVGLSHRAHALPPQMSGGEQQRVAIARALANRPCLLLADEPTGNLDLAGAERVLGLLERLRAESGTALVVVTHDAAIAGRADTRLRLEQGRLVAA
jgi:putative ABC transport system ATP-binding protein